MSVSAQALAPGEATMTVKVTKAGGEVIELVGSNVDCAITPELESAIREYKQTVARARELEAVISTLLKGA